MIPAIRIRGMGVVSSIGDNLQENLSSLLAGRAGIAATRLLDTIHRETLPVGEVACTREQLMDHLEIPAKESAHWSRTALLGLKAAKEAFLSAGLQGQDLRRTALVSASTVGGMDRTEKDYPLGAWDSGFIQTHPCGDATDKIAAALGLRGYRTTLSTACSSGANAIIHGAWLIRHGLAERVIAGGVDALSRFTLNGFNSLMILDNNLCRPFDKDRRGLNLGEGAGYLVLEAEERGQDHGTGRAAGSGEHRYYLSGWANTNDAFHQTASSPDGDAAFAAMAGALSMAGVETEGVDYINVHGTGTENNDAAEGAALRRLFGERVPPFSSTKSFTGHTLGAAAGLEAVYSVLALKEGFIPPSLRFRTPIEEPGLRPSVEIGRRAALTVVLSNSFGFGGNNSSLCFMKK